MACGAGYGVLDFVDLVRGAEAVDIHGPELVAIFPDPVHHFGRLAIPACGWQKPLFAIAVNAVYVYKVIYRAGMAPGFIVFIHEGIAEPKVLQIWLRIFVALGQRIDIVILVIWDGALVDGHLLVTVVPHVCFILVGELGLKGIHADILGIDACFVDWRLKIHIHIIAACAKQGCANKNCCKRHKSFNHIPPSFRLWD